MNLHPIFGYKSDLLVPHKFPTKLQVLNYVRHQIDSSPKKQQIHHEKVEKYREIAKEIIVIWKEAYVNCVSENAVTLRIENEIVSQIVYVKKTPRLLKNEEKKKELLSNLNKIFDIAYCKCYIDKTKEHYIYSNCVCPDGKKIVNFETYTQQVFDNEARILLSEEEKTKFELIWSAIRLSGKCSLYNMGPLCHYIIVCSSMQNTYAIADSCAKS